jgi:predicted lipoprotein with Yx(FWY)xxD motif
VNGAGFDPAKAVTPGVVALSQPSPGHWVLREFPSLANLYTRDADMGGRSGCFSDDGCAAVWPPLYASNDDKAIGDWTVIAREFGRKQWAYRSKPVYRRFHDLPLGADERGFRLLVP